MAVDNVRIMEEAVRLVDEAQASRPAGLGDRRHRRRGHRRRPARRDGPKPAQHRAHHDPRRRRRAGADLPLALVGRRPPGRDRHRHARVDRPAGDPRRVEPPPRRRRLARVPRLQHDADFYHRADVRRRHRLLPVPHRPLPRTARRGSVATRRRHRSRSTASDPRSPPAQAPPSPG